MKRKLISLIFLSSLVLLSLAAGTEKMNSPDMVFSCAADVTITDSSRTAEQDYAMGKDWKCKYKAPFKKDNKDVYAGDENIKIRNCLQYDDTSDPIELDNGTKSYKCLQCKCDYGLRHDNKECLENEFRTLHCFQYNEDQDCQECKYTFNENKADAYYKTISLDYKPYTTTNVAYYFQKHYKLDYGLKTITKDNQLKRYECINNQDSGKVEHCKVYKENTEDDCEICHFKEDWDYYYSEPADNTDKFDEDVGTDLYSGTNWHNQFKTQLYWKYKLYKYKPKTGDKFKCQHLPLYYETDPTRIEYLFQNDLASGRQYDQYDFRCKQNFLKITHFTKSYNSGTQNFLSMKRNLYKETEDSCNSHSPTAVDVGGCYDKDTIITNCMYADETDRIPGDTTYKRAGQKTFIDESGTRSDFSLHDGLARTNTKEDDFDGTTSGLKTQWKRFGTGAKCDGQCKLNAAKTRLINRNKTACYDKPDNCSAMGYNDKTCYTCASGYWVDYEEKCVLDGKTKVDNCVTTPKQMNNFNTSDDKVKCEECQKYYGYPNASDTAKKTSAKRFCTYNEREHEVMATGKTVDQDGFEIYGLGGCKYYDDHKNSAFAVGEATSCGACYTEYGFKTPSNQSGPSSGKRCLCKTGYDAKENEYSTNFCRKDTAGSDLCDSWFSIDSDGNDRCETCKNQLRSTFDGVECAKANGDIDSSDTTDFRDHKKNCGFTTTGRFNGASPATLNEKVCRVCKKGFTPNHLGLCVKDDQAGIYHWPQTGSADDYTKEPIFDGGVPGCRQVVHYMKRVSGTYPKVSYAWVKRCTQLGTTENNDIAFNDKCFERIDGLSSESAREKGYKSFHSEETSPGSGVWVDKCEYYENWELGRCRTPATPDDYINVQFYLYKANDKTDYKVTKKTALTMQQKNNCLLFDKSGANFICRKCKDSTNIGQNFALKTAAVSGKEASLGVDCVDKSSTELTGKTEQVTITSSYGKWKRKVIQCLRGSTDATKYALSYEGAGADAAVQNCVLSPLAVNANCRVTTRIQDGTGTDACPKASEQTTTSYTNMDYCRLDGDYGYIQQGTSTALSEASCVDNTGTNMKPHCLSYVKTGVETADATASPDCQVCKYGYDISSGNCVRHAHASAKDKCIEYVHIKQSKWNESEGSEICIRCVPGYVPVQDGSACVEADDPGCVVADNKTNKACQACAGPYTLTNKKCVENIPNCYKQSGVKCTKCEAGYGYFPDKSTGQKCILGMEGCTEYEQDAQGVKNEKKCKTCDKGCPTSGNDYDNYNWRYFGLTDVVKVSEVEYRYCVEGCVEFEAGTAKCTRCAKYSDSNAKTVTPGSTGDHWFYYRKNNVCFRRSYMSSDCEEYEEERDRCKKCTNQQHVDKEGHCADCTGTLAIGHCTAYDGIGTGESSARKCVCDVYDCDCPDIKTKYLSSVDATNCTCVDRKNVCISSDDTSYVKTQDLCTKCSYNTHYLKLTSGALGTCEERKSTCKDTCQYLDDNVDKCEQKDYKDTKKGCTDTTGTWIHDKKGWNSDHTCCITNVDDDVTNKNPHHCQLYNSDGCVKCAKDFFLVKTLTKQQKTDDPDGTLKKFKFVCMYRPNCASIKYYCTDPATTSKCTPLEVDQTVQDTAAKQQKYIREQTYCIECKNNAYNDNYGLLTNRKDDTGLGEAYCSKTKQTGGQWYEDTWLEQSQCCIKNTGLKQTETYSSTTYTLYNQIGCAEYNYDGSQSTVTNCKKCYNSWILREDGKDPLAPKTETISYCFYLETVCLSSAVTGCKLLNDNFTFDWITCKDCYHKEEHVTTVGYDINSHTFVCDLYGKTNDGGGNATDDTKGQGGTGKDGGITPLKTDGGDSSDGSGSGDSSGSSTDGSTFSSILSISLETIVIIAVGLLSLLI